jgi:Flp pilus assembly pilin Flp
VVEARPSSLRSQRGQALVEYATIVAVIGVCLVAILGLIGRATGRAYDRTAAAVSLPGNSGYSALPAGILTSTISHRRGHVHGPGEPPDDSLASGQPQDSSGGAATALL